MKMCTSSSFIRLTALAFVLVSVLVQGGRGSLIALNQRCCLFQSSLPFSSRQRRHTPTRAPGRAHVVTHAYDPILDWKQPSPELVQKTLEEQISSLQRLVSPIFFSTDRNGKRHVGLSRVPSNRPLLIVGNHQLGGFDMILVGAQLIEERNIFVRGLAHPVIFKNDDPSCLPESIGKSKDAVFHLYKTFGGAVLASPKNFYRLLQTQQVVLHFPGGAREAFHGKNEEYQIFWPNQTDFVRTAAKFNATVVPLSSIGAADSVVILASPETLLNLPIIGNLVAKSFLTVQEAARFDESGKPYIRPPPLVWPKLLPARHYFLFGTPFDLTDLDSRDKERCQKVYLDIQEELRRGLKDLLSAREKDPFTCSNVRFAYEQVTGKAAPTFSVAELNLTP